MYGYCFNTNVDNEAFVDLPDGRKVRVHQTGYVEGDTNGFVEGDYETFLLDENGDWYEEMSDEELSAWMLPDWADRPLELLEVRLKGELGRNACRNRGRSEVFEYDGKKWRVHKLKPVSYDADGWASIGQHNDYEAFYHLVTFGAFTVSEYIQDNTDWKNCDCASDGEW